MSNNTVTSSEKSKVSEEEAVSTTTNNDEEDSSYSESSSSSGGICAGGEEDSSDPAPSTNDTPRPPPTTSIGPKNFLRPSILRPPTITITQDKPNVTSTTSSTNFLRPSKLQVSSSSGQQNDKEEASTSSASSSSSSSAASKNSNTNNSKPCFMPLTKDSNNVNGDDGKKEEGSQESKAEFLFGENLSDRVSSTERKRKLDDGDDAQAESSKVPALEDVDVTTGEEGEMNVMQFNCRLYTFDNANWTERVSRGILRLNDTDAFNSRLIIRTQGSYRLMLNTKLFNGMVVERPNDKSVKFTAVDCADIGDEPAVKVFLVMGSYNDMESLYNALECRLRRFKKT